MFKLRAEGFAATVMVVPPPLLPSPFVPPPLLVPQFRVNLTPPDMWFSMLDLPTACTYPV
jgi:hypothetical protein